LWTIRPESEWNRSCGRAKREQYLSPRWLEYTGTAEDINANGGWTEAIHQEDRSKALQRWQTAVAQRSAYEAEYRLLRWDGEYHWHVARAVPMAESEGEEPLWFGTTTDIDERKRTQELLIRSEKVAALGRMAATLAHDINNPLAAAMNALYIVQSNVPKSLKEYVNMADAELRRISHITRQALGFYRESSQPGVVDVGSTLNEAVSLFKSKIKAKHICLQKENSSNLKVSGISGELRQVFSNLIANSVDAVPENGSIKVRVSHLTNPNTASRYVRVSVADDGVGIDANLLPHIFEPLFTTKGAIGTGLGLWESKQLVEKHGGSIRVRSCTGSGRRGTTFTVLLPTDLPTQHALVS
jgi:PAS domain S-box-containing protein